jgi:hypothetical protein
MSLINLNCPCIAEPRSSTHDIYVHLGLPNHSLTITLSSFLSICLFACLFIYPFVWSFFTCLHACSGAKGSSVSIESDYGLDDRVIGVRSPAGAKDLSSNLCVQTGSGVHPAPCTMGTEGPFPGAKRGQGVTLTTHPHLVPRSRMSRSYTSSPSHAPPWRVAELLCFSCLFVFVCLLSCLLTDLGLLTSCLILKSALENISAWD